LRILRKFDKYLSPALKLEELWGAGTAWGFAQPLCNPRKLTSVRQYLFLFPFTSHGVGEILGQVCGYVCYGLGRRVVPFLTAGLVRAAEARDEKLAFPWYGLARGRCPQG